MPVVSYIDSIITQQEEEKKNKQNRKINCNNSPFREKFGSSYGSKQPMSPLQCGSIHNFIDVVDVLKIK